MGIVLVLAAVGCGGEEAGPADTGMPAVSDTVAGATPAPSPADPAGSTVRVADITGNPEQYIGRTVTVEADVEEVLSPMAFTLDEDAPVAGGIDNALRVFSPQSARLANIDDQWLNNRVRVTGTVRRVTVVELERELGWDLNPEIEAEIEGNRPVMIASSIQRVNGQP